MLTILSCVQLPAQMRPVRVGEVEIQPSQKLAVSYDPVNYIRSRAQVNGETVAIYWTGTGWSYAFQDAMFYELENGRAMNEAIKANGMIRRTRPASWDKRVSVDHSRKDIHG